MNASYYPVGSMVRLDIPTHTPWKTAVVVAHEARTECSDPWKGEWLKVQPVFAGTYGYHNDGPAFLVRPQCVRPAK